MSRSRIDHRPTRGDHRYFFQEKCGFWSAERDTFLFFSLCRSSRGDLGFFGNFSRSALPCFHPSAPVFSRQLSRWQWGFPETCVVSPVEGQRRQGLRERPRRRPSSSRRQKKRASAAFCWQCSLFGRAFHVLITRRS